MIGVFAGNIGDVQNLVNNVKVLKTSTFGQSVIKTCSLNNKNIIIAGTGYGKANIGSCFGYIYANCPLKSVICVGNCGAIRNNNINLNTIAISTGSTQFDVNFSAIGYPSPLIPGLSIANYISNDNLSKLAQISSHLRSCNYNEGLFASGDQFVADNTLSQSIASNYGATFIDNETGVLGELCCINRISFVAVKGISNYADKNAAEEYHNNKKRCNCISSEIANTMLNLITKSVC